MAGSFTTHHTKSFLATTDLAAFVRVKLGAAGYVSIAGATEDCIGVTVAPVLAGSPVGVRLKNSSGSALFTAASAVAANAPVYGVAAGQVDDVPAGNVLVGYALDAAVGAGSVIEVLLAR